ncbi:MAG: methyltransferase domain-containing protein [Burkholderiales bacterium]|jgi:phosphatidylethanolamine/phosphatidyl-N-methylethanolamine N-methyltransferase|nr:methyltransferase domain-containing protein [Burkholderiales bacterium]
MQSQRRSPIPDRSRHGGARLARTLQDEARFLRSWLDNPLMTGAISPSSPFLANAMAKEVDPASDGPVIELGPGTGPVTQALVERGIAQERLVLVEYDPEFCRLLARRFPRARIVRGDAYALDTTLRGLIDRPAAAVVSSLPLLTRPEEERARLLLHAFRLMAPEAPFVQFTYGLASPVPRGPGVTSQVSAPVWRNIPPARVWVYRKATVADGEALAGHREPHILRRLKEHTGRMRDGFLDRTERVLHAIEEQTDKVRDDRRLRPTLELIRRINAHMDGPDTHRAADAALRTRERWPGKT